MHAKGAGDGYPSHAASFCVNPFPERRRILAGFSLEVEVLTLLETERALGSL